jgi:hypothetical protein
MLYLLFPELVALGYLSARARARLAAARADERGMTTETVVVTAMLVIMALTAVGIITNKVLNKANSISLE